MHLLRAYRYMMTLCFNSLSCLWAMLRFQPTKYLYTKRSRPILTFWRCFFFQSLIERHFFTHKAVHLTNNFKAWLPHFSNILFMRRAFCSIFCQAESTNLRSPCPNKCTTFLIFRLDIIDPSAFCLHFEKATAQRIPLSLRTTSA